MSWSYINVINASFSLKVALVCWLQSVRDMITSSGKSCIIILMSEIFPDKLRLFTQVDVWVRRIRHGNIITSFGCAACIVLHLFVEVAWIQ